MGGHMVAVLHEGSRHFYMANIDDREQAIAEVERRSGISGAEALAPLECATLDHFEVPIAEVRPYLVTDPGGKVAFSDT